ncbi:MAG: inositol monophosphatase family protein, partial [Candidatus Kariarchaeaceae archaeon]
MWLYESLTEIDMKINKALQKAKRSIMGSDTIELRGKASINAAGQLAIKADVQAEGSFLKTLIDEGLSGTLYSEESGVLSFGNPREGDEKSVILLLDPLDGSQNYLKGIPFGCISVAYGAYKESPILSDLDTGVIMNLYQLDEFFVRRGRGAYKNGENLVSFEARNLPPFDQRPIQISYYAYGDLASQYAFDFQEYYSLRSLGSAAWELALATESRNDAFVDLRGVLKAHDFAAARLIINELGGELRFFNIDSQDIENIPLDDFKQGYAIIASLDTEFLTYL